MNDVQDYQVKIGAVYRHYKGNFYKVVGFATHTDDYPLVLYRSCFSNSTILWARPMSEFCEKFDDGTSRFEQV